MITNKEVLDLMFRERESLRQEVLSLEKTMFKTLFVFLTLFFAFTYLYFNMDSFEIDGNFKTILCGLSQFEFICWFYIVFLVTDLGTIVGHVRSLEDQINVICERPVSIWESQITKHFIASPKGLVYWLTTGFVFASFCLFVLSNILTLKFLQNVWLSILLSLEIVLIIFVIVRGMPQINRVQNFSNEVFKKEI